MLDRKLRPNQPRSPKYCVRTLSFWGCSPEQESSADKSLEPNRLFVEYQKFFGQAQKLGKEILKQLAGGWLPVSSAGTDNQRVFANP